jgi:hypothetical protein
MPFMMVIETNEHNTNNSHFIIFTFNFISPPMVEDLSDQLLSVYLTESPRHI